MNTMAWESLFMENLRLRGLSEATIATRTRSLRVFSRYLGGLETITQADRKTIEGYGPWLRSQDYTPWSVITHLSTAWVFLNFLHRAKLLPWDGSQWIHLRRITQLPRNILTPMEARRVLESVNANSPRGIRDRAIMELFYASGIRLAEMTALTVEDVDFRNALVRVLHGKGGKDRLVPMGSEAMQWLSRYLRDVRPTWSRMAHRALWLSSIRLHPRLSSTLIGLMVRQRGKASGISKRLTPHVWRHSVASHLVSQGSDLATIQNLLGHASIETTAIYTRVAVTDLKEMMASSHPRRAA